MTSIYQLLQPWRPNCSHILALLAELLPTQALAVILIHLGVCQYQLPSTAALYNMVAVAMYGHLREN